MVIYFGLTPVPIVDRYVEMFCTKSAGHNCAIMLNCVVLTGKQLQELAIDSEKIQTSHAQLTLQLR